MVIPDGIKNIENNTFFGCTGLSGNIVLPEGIEKVGDYAFYKCGGFDGTLTLPSTLKDIGAFAFRDCSNLKGNLNLPDGLKTIAKGAFYQCSSLTGNIIIPEGIEEIGEHTFNTCSGFDGKLSLPSTLKSIGTAAFQDCIKLSGELILPEGLEYIGDFAFSKCRNFENTVIKIPASLTKIGEDYDLNGINVGIGSHLFYNFGADVRKFEAIEVEEGNNNFVAKDGVLYTKDLKRLVCYPRNKKDTTYEIQEGVELLDQMSIASNMTLNTLILPDSLIITEQTYPEFTWENDHLLDYSLYNYNAIENIEVKDTNPNYKSDDGVLYTKDMKNLVYISSGRTKEVIIPDGVETINDNSIYWSQVARSVSKIYIPASVINLSDRALNKVNNGFIKKIEISEDNPSFTLDSNGKLIRK